MNTLSRLLQDNKSWSKRMMENEPDFFSKLLNVQHPEFLWIGCSDSRVLPDVIT